MHLSKKIIATSKPNLNYKTNCERMKIIYKKFKIWTYELDRINLQEYLFLFNFFFLVQNEPIENKVQTKETCLSFWFGQFTSHKITTCSSIFSAQSNSSHKITNFEIK